MLATVVSVKDGDSFERDQSAKLSARKMPPSRAAAQTGHQGNEESKSNLHSLSLLILNSLSSSLTKHTLERRGRVF